MTPPSLPALNRADLDNTIVVLNDGETYTDLRGCTLLTLPAELEDGEDWEVEQYIRLSPCG